MAKNGAPAATADGLGWDEIERINIRQTVRQAASNDVLAGRERGGESEDKMLQIL